MLNAYPVTALSSSATEVALSDEIEAVKETLRLRRLELERRARQPRREVALQIEAARTTRDELLADVDEALRSIGWLRSELRVLKSSAQRRSSTAACWLRRLAAWVLS